MATTIKVSSLTRDRVNALGAATDQTADQVIARALVEYERSLFWQEYAAASDAVSADPEASELEAAEQAMWDRPLKHGRGG